ncbi:uncharacterized protein LOC135201406 isoform X2 [Macrobrachium nipponense]|uniref:uncharacterized protein LOC135201406 isoform X2 n=1 Tax=Macrobrachium nipponense TaxID=159736 RepID=UPI0030C81C3C
MGDIWRGAWGDNKMAPRPEDSPVSSPRTRSPVKGARAGGTSCAASNSMSMLTMLAEVASVTLHTDPSVTDTNTNHKSKASPPGSRKPSDCEILTLNQVAGMTDNLLVKLFAEFESNEMWKRFTYSCRMLPAACSKCFQSFGSEHKARTDMKAHLQSHLKNLLGVHTSQESRQAYVLESIPARNRRLVEQDTPGGKKRTVPSASRNTKTAGSPKPPNLEGTSKTKKGTIDNPKVQAVDEGREASPVNITVQIPAMEVKTKRKSENREGRVRIKKPKNSDARPTITNGFNDNNNNTNNNNEAKSDANDVIEPSSTPPMQEIVSHDHGYLKASTSIKTDSLGSKDHVIQGSTLIYKEPPPPRTKSHLNQVTTVGNDSGIGSCISVCVKETPEEDKNTLLHQHMNQELEGEIMAQDSSCDATPLPVVGSEVEFTPDQQYKVMRSADLPVVYDHNNPLTKFQAVSRVIERDEYKVRKKPKGRAKFIGQSKAEKEMALKLITEIRSQSVMSLDPLECKICHPSRLFTALSTLLSHYRSHAGIRPYECRICEAVFTRQHSLNYHMLIHTNQTRFTCVDCDRKFRHPSHFKEHRRRHTGESPYECSDCLMRFKTRNTYKRHLRTRHGKLLTTQGAIIILSQEEADRMKKTQGRKPRRPRQPLQIISPETAAQMEEEQIWTDFEEGDHEDEFEFEEEDDDDGEEHSPLDLTKKVGQGKFESIPLTQLNGTIFENMGVQAMPNGKTGFLLRPKVSVSKNELMPNLGIYVNPNNVSKTAQITEEEVEFNEEMKGAVENTVEDVHTYVFHSTSQNNAVTKFNVMPNHGIYVDPKGVTKPVDVKEKDVEFKDVSGALENVVEDVRTYVFHPTSQNNSVPKVNVKSSWNTVNIDLKNLERATNSPSESVVYCDKQTVLENDHTNKGPVPATTVLTGNSADYLGDNINPEEVITICAGVDSGGKDVVLSPLVETHTSSTGVKPDFFTVKKPLKCYGRPGYTTTDNSNNVLSSGGATVTTNQVDSQSSGVYFIVQGQDGRLAKVFHQSNGSVSKPSQQITVQSTGCKLKSSNDSLQMSLKNKTKAKPAKSESKITRECVTAQSVKPSVVSPKVIYKPIKTVTRRNIGVSPTSDNKIIINKQVVNNVVVKNHIVQNGSLVKVKCEERDASLHRKSTLPIVSVVPVTSAIHSSPIIVTSGTSLNKSASLPAVIATSVGTTSSVVEPPSSVVYTSVSPSSVSLSAMQSHQTPVILSSSDIVTSVTHIPRNASSRVSGGETSQKAVLTWQGQPSAGNVIAQCMNGTSTVMRNKADIDNGILYTGEDSFVAVKEELLLENVPVKEELLLGNVEIIDNLDSNHHMNVAVNGIVQKDGTVTFSSSDVKLESDLNSNAPYVDPLIQD